MKRICVIGHFGFGKNMLNGQTIKTKLVTAELEKQYGTNQVSTIDSHGGLKVLFKISFQMLKSFIQCENIIILPAHNGIKFFVPMCVLFRFFFHRKIHYVVIGGWLPSYLENRKVLTRFLKNFDGIFVETNNMKKSFEDKAFENVEILYNFKDLKIVDKSELMSGASVPYRVCTFSRVMREKGIEDAVEVIKEINEKNKKTVYELDIYGQVDENEVEWFQSLQKSFPDYVCYKGSVNANESVDVLKNYFALLFPTHFYTEGIPGTILDGYASGLPVISARWNSFADVVDDKKTGLGFEFGNTDDLKKVLEDVMTNPELIDRMREQCLIKAQEYLPEVAIMSLIAKL